MDAVSSPGDTSSPDEEISFDFWLPLLWFHMATWLWPIAPALQATKSQDQHQAESIFLRNNPSKASVHIQVPTRDLIGYGQNNSLQNCKKFSLWIQGRTPALLSPWLGGGWGPYPWDEGRHPELTLGGGIASSEGLSAARNVQAAFRGRWPPSRSLLGEESTACAWVHFPPGIWARGRKGNSCFLSSLALSVVLL